LLVIPRFWRAWVESPEAIMQTFALVRATVNLQNVSGAFQDSRACVKMALQSICDSFHSEKSAFGGKIK